MHFRFPRARIFQNHTFCHCFMVAGLGITQQLTGWETVVSLILFTFSGVLRLPESSIKILGMKLMGWNKIFDPTLCGGSVPGLVPEIYVTLHVAFSSSMIIFMIAYVKLKHVIFGVIWSSFWGIYTQAKHLRDWILHSDWLNDSLQKYC